MTGDATPNWVVTEPSSARVTPRRVLPGGAVDVDVDPAALGGAASPVSVDVVGGPVEWTSPLALETDGHWRGRLLVPATESTLHVTVTVGGRALGVHPAIYVRP